MALFQSLGLADATRKLISFDENLCLDRVVYLFWMETGVVFSLVVDPGAE